jgi:acetyl-CoA synthase
MKLLFNRVFDGVDEMYARAEKAMADAIAAKGEGASCAFPDTAYALTNHYAYLGDKISTLGELKAAWPKVKEWNVRDQHLGAAFRAGYGTVMAAEVIEACKYAMGGEDYATAQDEDGHESKALWGAFKDSEVRDLGVPLVTGEIPGFVVIIGPVPSDEEAAELIKGYQTRMIFVFLLGGIIDQAKRMNIKMGFPVRVVPVSYDISGVTHIISVVNRAAMIFGAVKPTDKDAFDDYSFNRIRAFVNAFAPVPDIVVGCGGGAIAMGFPVITNDTQDMWPVPKSLIVQQNTKDFIETSLEARDIKIKVTKIDIPVAFSNSFEGEIIRRADMQVDIDGSRVDCFEWVRMRDSKEIEDHKIEVVGPDIDSVPAGSRFNMGYIVDVCGKNMQADFEPVFERKIHNFLNCVEGVMHTGQRDLIRIRVGKAAFDAGFRAKHIGEVLYAKIKSEYEAVVDKVQVTIYTKPEDCKKLRAEANEVYNKRDDRLASLTDESVDVFYSCTLCQSFSPSHVCVVTPERLGLCGAVSWLDAKATRELDPHGPSQVVTKERVVDENLGIWEDVNDFVKGASHGSLEQVSLYSILQDPMTSCGCFECICGYEGSSNGFVIVNREHTGMTPVGMSFSEMASMTGGGVQTPGFMGLGKHFIASKKFLRAEGGVERIVWMPKALKEFVQDKLNVTAKELYGIDNFTDLVADETICEDAEGLMTFLQEKNHPVLKLEALM